MELEPPKLLDEGGQGIQTVAELSKSGNACHYLDLVREDPCPRPDLAHPLEEKYKKQQQEQFGPKTTSADDQLASGPNAKSQTTTHTRIIIYLISYLSSEHANSWMSSYKISEYMNSKLWAHTLLISSAAPTHRTL